MTVFHLDTDFGKNLPYWKQLPKGSYVLELDSTTDIFAAKQALFAMQSQRRWQDILANLRALEAGAPLQNIIFMGAN